MKFSVKLRKIIERSGHSNKEFAVNCGMNKSQVYNYINDKQLPGMDFFIQMKKKYPWVKFNGNIVVIGFNRYPKDLRTIMRAAALHGNRVYGFGIHLWAVDAKYKNWNVWKDPYICTTTARHGEIEENTCK